MFVTQFVSTIKCIIFCCKINYSSFVSIVFHIASSTPTTYEISVSYYFLWLYNPARAMASSFTRFRGHTQRRATVGRTPLDE
jgi:hypothetical protein